MVANAMVSLREHRWAFAFGAIDSYVVVAKYSGERKLTFRAGTQSPNRAVRALQHRVQLQQKTQNKSTLAKLPKRILSAGVAKVELPPLPSLSR